MSKRLLLFILNGFTFLGLYKAELILAKSKPYHPFWHVYSLHFTSAAFKTITPIPQNDKDNVTASAELPLFSLLSSLLFKGFCCRWENWKVKRACLPAEHLQFALPIWARHHLVGLVQKGMQYMPCWRLYSTVSMHYWVRISKCKFTASGAGPAGFDPREKYFLILYYRHF